MRDVTFGERHSYKDFNLITNEIQIGYPQVKTSYVDIPGGNGSLDFTEGMGGVKYGNRSLTFRFTLIGDWEDKKSMIAGYLHGKKHQIIIDKDEDFYFIGRCNINEFLSSRSLSTLVLQVECEPFKYKGRETIYTEIAGEEKTIILENNRMEVVPDIEVKDGTVVIQKDRFSYELKEGMHKILDFQLKEGYNRFKIKGNGMVVFRYREGAL